MAGAAGIWATQYIVPPIRISAPDMAYTQVIDGRGRVVKPGVPPSWFDELEHEPTYGDRLLKAGWIRRDGTCSWDPEKPSVFLGIMQSIMAEQAQSIRADLNQPAGFWNLIAEKNALGKTPLKVPKVTIRKRVSRFFARWLPVAKTLRKRLDPDLHWGEDEDW